MLVGFASIRTTEVAVSHSRMSQNCLACLRIVLLSPQLPTLPCQLKEKLQLFWLPNASLAAELSQSTEQDVLCSSKSCHSLGYAGIWSQEMRTSIWLLRMV